jgi:hypothetical protein
MTHVTSRVVESMTMQTISTSSQARRGRYSPPALCPGDVAGQLDLEVVGPEVGVRTIVQTAVASHERPQTLRRSTDCPWTGDTQGAS